MRNKIAKILQRLSVARSPVKESRLMVTQSGAYKYPPNTPRALYKKMKRQHTRG